jgi:hypothetical protein
VVRRDFEATLMSAGDLPSYTDLAATRVRARAVLPLGHGLLGAVVAGLVAVWSDVRVEKPDPALPDALPVLVVCGRVTLRLARAAPAAAPDAQPAGSSLHSVKHTELFLLRRRDVLKASLSFSSCLVL